MNIRRLRQMWRGKPVCEYWSNYTGWSFIVGLFGLARLCVDQFGPPEFDLAVRVSLLVGPFDFCVEWRRCGIVEASWKVDAMLGKDDPHWRYPLYLIGES